MKAFRLIFGLGIFSAFVSCGVDPINPSVRGELSAQDQIIGGEETVGDPSVVAIFGAEPNAETGSLCTATFIAPQVLLTAAHCVDPSVVGERAVFVAVLGHDLNSKETQGEILEVAQTHAHPGFDLNDLQGGNDIGVVILAEPYIDAAPIPFNTAPLANGMVGEPARIVGYGLNDGWTQSGAGVKREATVELNSYDDKFVKTGVGGRGICSGDSGGPVLMDIDGEETIVGVNSFGFIFCLGEASSTRVDRYVDFVEQFLD